MAVVDYLLNSLIKRLQKTQKLRQRKVKARKRAKAKARRARKSRKAKKPVLHKPKPAKRKKRAPGRSAKRFFQKTTKKKTKRTKKPSKKPARKAKTKRKSPKPAKRPASKTAAKSLPPKEKSIGEVTHFFSNIKVVVIKVTGGRISVGDKIRIKGRTSDFVQTVKSLQIESVDVRSAKKGQLAGLKVPQKAKPGDQIFKVA